MVTGSHCKYFRSKYMKYIIAVSTGKKYFVSQYKTPPLPTRLTPGISRWHTAVPMMGN
ncbi:hypothetical protein BX666DRAFT_1938554 [Dichotomocladium elegans]|nr:hypothetical protein BX666DRAFT_1938554 [Dichotomocladium elegans]